MDLTRSVLLVSVGFKSILPYILMVRIGALFIVSNSA